MHTGPHIMFFKKSTDTRLRSCAMHRTGLLPTTLCHRPGKNCQRPRGGALSKACPPHIITNTVAKSIEQNFNLSLPGCPAKKDTGLRTALQPHTGPQKKGHGNTVVQDSERDSYCTLFATAPGGEKNSHYPWGGALSKPGHRPAGPPPKKGEQCSRALTEHCLGCPLTGSVAQPSQALQA